MPRVTFKQSGITAEWKDGHASLLELAEAEGLTLDYGCRMGSCTACQQLMISGNVNYPDGHSGMPDEGHVLLCCSIPETDVVIDA